MPPGAASTLGGGINSDHLYDAVAHREAIHYAAAGHVDDRFKFQAQGLTVKTQHRLKVVGDDADVDSIFLYLCSHITPLCSTHHGLGFQKFFKSFQAPFASIAGLLITAERR